MREDRFKYLKIGQPVTYMGLGKGTHKFYFVIAKINEDNKTVDIERYLELTGKKDENTPIYKTNVSLSDIEFIKGINNIHGIDPNTFFPK